MNCQKEKNLKDCACTYPGCPRKGICCECVRYHREKNEIPGCFFSKKGEALFDRGLERFLEDKK